MAKEYTKDDTALMNRFIVDVAKARPGDKIDSWRYGQAGDDYSRAEAAWLRFGIYRRHGIPLLCWYQNELDKPNQEWRSAVIMRAVLAAAQLTEETTGIPDKP